MTVFNVERSIDGLFSALYLSFTEKVVPDKIISENQLKNKYGIKTIKVSTDIEHSNRVGKALYYYGGKELLDRFSHCLLSDDERALDVCFYVAHTTLSYRKDFSKNTELEKVMQFLSIEDKVVREKNRLTRSLEFAESDGGILYASISPSANVSSLLAPYFYGKFKRLPFILHDVKRGSIVASNGYTLHLTDTEINFDLLGADSQQQFDKLWKRCYREILLKEKRLQKITLAKN